MSDEKTSIFDTLRQRKKAIDDYFERESKVKAEAWGVYGADHERYAAFFGLPTETLPTFIESVRKKHVPYGLDLLSGTEMLASLKIGGIAVGLTDARSQEQKVEDENTRWQLDYDLLHERKLAWRAIRRTMVFHHIPAFDLIAQRGILGFELITPDPALHLYHLQQMWSVLAEGGMLLTEIGSWDSDILEKNKTYDFWSRIKGIEASATPRRGLLLLKSAGAPKTLPLNFTSSLKELKRWKVP